MVSCAVGLTAGAKIPFVSTFGKFLIRACDQIEMALIGRANLKLVGSHCGVSPAADGPSQMGLSDMGFFRAFTKVSDDRGGPLLYVLQPADAVAAYALTAAMAEHEGACYLRVHRPDVPLIYPPDTEFSLGGHHVLGRGSDVLLVASGYMVHAAREAIRHLAEHEISATLVDLYSLPCDARALSELARGCGGKVVTLEDNYAGGIGSAVAEALLEHDGELRLEQIHVRQVPKSGRTPTAVLEHLGLDVGDVVQRCKDMQRRETPS
jgi:transketolase